jgi:tRNA-specific 2-thiouridylase
MRLGADMAGAPIAVAMSGGVDSSVAAGLLLRAGERVLGLSMALWSEDGAPPAPQRARLAAETLGIPLQVLDLREAFRRQVVDYLIAEYGRGRTPNPCLVCNRNIKFGLLLEAARRLGAAGLATGHYARAVYRDGRWRLLRGMDRRKDQSYVLYMLGQTELAFVRFPLGEMTKNATRRLAAEWGLPASDAPESQEACFIADGDYRRFLRQHAPQLMRPGPILDTAGRQIGEHAGLAFYTIGQRKGLGITRPEPWYVVALDAARNAVIAGPARELGGDVAWAEDVSYIAGQTPAAPFTATAKIRYQAVEAEVEVIPRSATSAEVHFAHPQRDITPGQGIVFYAGEEVLGGGVIGRPPQCEA